MRSASSKADVGFFLFNSFLATALFGWAILSYHFVSTTANEALASAFGARQPTSLSEFHSAGILTVALFLAYELGYWLDHYLSHKVPILWEFHKVHHSAEVLSPLTNFRVHPVDTLVFYNILALIMGGTGGLVHLLARHGHAALHHCQQQCPDAGLLLPHRPPAAFAFLDRVHGPLGSPVPEPGASPDPSFDQPYSFRQEPRQLPGRLGLAVRDLVCPRQDAGKIELRRRAQEPGRAHGHRRADHAPLQCLCAPEAAAPAAPSLGAHAAARRRLGRLRRRSPLFRGAARTCSRSPSRDKVSVPREVDFARARNFGLERVLPPVPEGTAPGTRMGQ